MACFRVGGDGIVLSVRLTPKGGRDAIDGITARDDGREVLAVRVRAAPDKGAANAAMVALIADAFGRPRSAVQVVSGLTGRLKQVAIDGDPRALAAIAERLPRG